MFGHANFDTFDEAITYATKISREHRVKMRVVTIGWLSGHPARFYVSPVRWITAEEVNAWMQRVYSEYANARMEKYHSDALALGMRPIVRRPEVIKNGRTGTLDSDGTIHYSEGPVPTPRIAF